MSGRAISLPWLKVSLRSLSDDVGLPFAAGITASELRSPIHMLGSWEMPMPFNVGPFCASLARWYWYSVPALSALVIGVMKLNPFGQATAGKLLPRENPPVELVPRRVSTYETRPSEVSRAATSAIVTSSIHPVKAVAA